MSDVPNLDDVVLKDRSYYNFYEAFIECDFLWSADPWSCPLWVAQSKVWRVSEPRG